MRMIIDTTGQAEFSKKKKLRKRVRNTELQATTSDTDPLVFLDSADLLLEDDKSAKKKKINPSKDIDLDSFELAMNWKKNRKKQTKNQILDKAGVHKLATELSNVDKIMEKSVIKPGFEQLEAVPPYNEQQKSLVKQRRKEREKTMGSQWYNLPATEMTDEIKHDLEVIQMRSVLDPKHFYKKNDLKALPKYFQIGKVMDSPVEYYSGRLTKKERKTTIVDELMANAEFAKYSKRKYKEIIDEKRKHHYKAHKHARRLKGKRKK